MMASTDRSVAANRSTKISWQPEWHVASVGYAPGANLTAEDGTFLIDFLNRFIGTNGEPFAVLADAHGLGGTDAAYRATASGFFHRHRAEACIALFNMGPAIRILTEMFRIGTGVQLKAFADEPAARSWLRTRGFAE